MNVSAFPSLETFYRGTPTSENRTMVTNRPVTISMDGVPDGEYIIRIFHDANSDGKLNSNAFGVPTEVVLFYHPAAEPGEAVRPRDALFQLDENQRHLELKLPAPGVESRAWGVGVMTILSSNPYRGGNTVVRVLPLLTYVGESAYVIGPRVGYNLHKSRFLSANLTAEFKFAGDAFKDEKFLEGMENRRDTVMAGFDLSLRGFGRWRIDANALTDVMGRHDGQESTLSIGRGFRGRQWSITPGAGIVWRSSNYNNYYYGVNRDEATDERPGSSIEWFGRIFSRYAFNDSWSFLASVKTELLSDYIKDSPIVDKKFLTSAFLGINYAF